MPAHWASCCDEKCPQSVNSRDLEAVALNDATIAKNTKFDGRRCRSVRNTAPDQYVEKTITLL